MNRKRIFIIVAGLGLLSLGITSYRACASRKSEGVLYGNVDIREATLSFRVAGRVSEVLVDEGATVKAGDPLARLDVEPLQNALRAAESAAGALEARNALIHRGYRTEDAAQARARLDAARAAFTDADLTLGRQKALISSGATSRSALDSAQAGRDQAAAQLRVAEEQVRAMNTGFRKEEIAESDAQLRQAQAQVATARLALQDAQLTAPSEGVVLTRAIEKGTQVQAGTPAFSLSLTRPVWVRAYVGEPQMGRFSPGTRVQLRTDARSGRIYHGTVGFVSPTAEFTPKSVETVDLRTTLVYRLRIVVEDPDTQLRQGMPVTVVAEAR